MSYETICDLGVTSTCQPPSEITSLHHQAAIKMPKRKRDGPDSPEAVSAEEPGMSMRQRRVEHKLDLGYKQLNKAFKTAKGFERQKLGRRRKTACEKGDSKDVERIDDETEAIKVGHFSISMADACLGLNMSLADMYDRPLTFLLQRRIIYINHYSNSRLWPSLQTYPRLSRGRLRQCRMQQQQMSLRAYATRILSRRHCPRSSRISSR